MSLLALRNLFHDKIRLAVTLTGVAFSVVLMVGEIGLFQGFSKSTTSLIDHSNADLWIAAKNTTYIDQAVEFNERRYYQVLATPGVAEAVKYLVRWSVWRESNGRTESVEVVGCDFGSQMGQPWNLVLGNVNQLKRPNGVIIDRLYMNKLKAWNIGDTAEMYGNRARIVGFTKGLRAFTTSPYVFTSFKNAKLYTELRSDETNFILVRSDKNVSAEELKRRLQAKLPDNDVFTTKEFSSMTRDYWMFTTGAGAAVLMAAVLGLIVGIAVVAQTIYATTMDHIREYGTLKAIGAPNSYVLGVIMVQAVIAALIGFAIGLTISLVIVEAGWTGEAAIELSSRSVSVIFLLTLGMCLSAAIVSVQKVLSIDPAIVFKS